MKYVRTNWSMRLMLTACLAFTGFAGTGCGVVESLKGDEPIETLPEVDIPQVDDETAEEVADPGVFKGDVRITSLGELEAYQNYHHIEGNLTISTSALKIFSWPNLRKVDGHLWLWSNTQLKEFSFPGLETLAGSLLVRENGELTSFSFSQLQAIGGRLSVVYNRKLSDCLAEELALSVGPQNINDGVTLTGNRPNSSCND